MEPVLKTGDPATGRGFESHSLRHFFSKGRPVSRHVPEYRLALIRSDTQEAEGAPLLRE